MSGDADLTNIEGKRVLITGGAGFIGTSLALRLAPKNEVVLYDNLTRNAFEKTELEHIDNVSLVVGDVLDAESLSRAARGCHHIVHMASIAGVDNVMQAPVRTMKVSILGTYNAIVAAQSSSSIERFVDFSTSEVFGRFAFRVTEGDATQLGAVGEARWTYAVSKLATEHLALSYHKQYGLPALSVRPFNVYGPRQVGAGAVHHFIVKALRGEELTIHNDGSQIRAWCFIDDMVQGIVRAMSIPGAVGQAFNIGNPRSTVTIHQLAREIVRLSESKSTIRHIPWDFPDVELRIPDIGKAREVLGFEPEVDLQEGLLKTIAWYRSQMGL